MRINVNFWLKFGQNTAPFPKITQSAELDLSVWKQCGLASLKRDELVFWTPRFFSLLISALFHVKSTFWLDSTLMPYLLKLFRKKTEMFFELAVLLTLSQMMMLLYCWPSIGCILFQI